MSNVYYNEPAARLGELLIEHSFADRVFFCNSGAEANEAAIKLARRHGARQLGGRYEILTVLGSFHGRTIATLSATAQEKYQSGFQPLLQGFRYVRFGDVAAMRAAVRPETVAILVEPIQGEGGVNVPPAGYLRQLRELCDEKRLLLMLDEVQVGMGRTGTLFAYEQEGIRPDVVTLAKALGGGLPIGAMLTTETIAGFARRRRARLDLRRQPAHLRGRRRGDGGAARRRRPGELPRDRRAAASAARRARQGPADDPRRAGPRSDPRHRARPARARRSSPRRSSRAWSSTAPRRP